MARRLSVAVFMVCLPALGLLASGCAPKTSCGRLAAAICDAGTEAECAAFVTAQIAARTGPLADAHRESACQIVLDDKQTTAALERAFVERRAATGS